VGVGLMLSTLHIWVLDFLSCPLREEDRARSHNTERDSSWLLRGRKGLPDLHSNTEQSGGEERCQI
jgi:hypothetical protein